MYISKYIYSYKLSTIIIVIIIDHDPYVFI